MAKNEIGAIWRPEIERNGRFYALLVTQDGEGSCSIELRSGTGTIPHSKLMVSGQALDEVGKPKLISMAIINACQDDLTNRLKSGEFDAFLK